MVDDYIIGYSKLYQSHGVQIDKLTELKESMSSGSQRPMMGESESGTRGSGSMREKMSEIRESSTQIRTEMLKLHKSLDGGMKSTLNEKELKKWTKYYEDLCEDNNFSLVERKRPSREGSDEMGGGMQGGGGMRGGMGGGGF